MVNNTTKVVVAALLIVSAQSLATGPYQCNSAQGNNITIKGNSTCNPTGDVSLTGRKRGDRVAFDQNFMNKFASAQQLQNQGDITFPKAGNFAYYKLGNTKIAIGTFDLKASNANLPAALRNIIAEGKKNNPDADVMTWFGRSLANEGNTFTELAETFSKKGVKNSLTYHKTGANSVAIVENGEETITVDMLPVK